MRTKVRLFGFNYASFFNFINVIIANHSLPMVLSTTSMAILFCDITKPLENDFTDIVHCIHESESGAKQKQN